MCTHPCTCPLRSLAPGGEAAVVFAAIRCHGHNLLLLLWGRLGFRKHGLPILHSRAPTHSFGQRMLFVCLSCLPLLLLSRRTWLGEGAAACHSITAAGCAICCCSPWLPPGCHCCAAAQAAGGVHAAWGG